MQRTSLLLLAALVPALTLAGRLRGQAAPAQLPSGAPAEAPSSAVQGLRLSADGLDFTLVTEAPVVDAEGLVRSNGLRQRLLVPGAPALPFYATFIAVPPGAQLTINAVVPAEDAFRAPAVQAVPGLAPADLSLDETGELRTTDGQPAQLPDPAIYGDTAPYPADVYSLSGPMRLGGLKLYRLALYPLRYRPAAGELLHAPELVVRARFNAPPAPSDGPWQASPPPYLGGLVLNLEQARGWEIPAAEQGGGSTELPIGVDVYKIEVNRDGIYRLSYADLAAVGMDVGAVNPQTFQMLYQGELVAYHFEGDADAEFEPGEAVLFYGWAFDGSRLESQFFVSNVFWLWAGGTPAVMGERDSQAGDPAEHFISSQTRQPEKVWFPTWTDDWAQFPNEPDAWYWDKLNKGTALPITRTYTLTLPHPAAAGPAATFTAEFSSKLSPVVGGLPVEHTVQVHLNRPAGYASGSWLDIQNVNVSEDLPVAELINGPNEFEVVLATAAAVGESNSVYLNRLTVDYPRLFVADGDELLFGDAQSGPRQYSIADFSQSDPAEYLIWDISNRLQPQAIDPATAVISGAGPYTLTFGTADGAAADFIATTQANLLAPAGLSQYVGPDLEPAAGGAAWLGIAYQEFLLELERLAEHRALPQFGGFATHTVNIADVINQYGYGLPTPNAIRAYLQHAAAAWSPAPAYLTLAGDATLNPRGNLHNGNPFTEPQLALTDLVFVDRFQGQIPSDYSFSLLAGDDLLPELAAGRLPGKTITDTAAMVDKIILYDQNNVTPAAWMNNVVFVSDDADAAGDFCTENQLAGEHIPTSYEKTYLCLGQSPTVTDAVELREDLFGFTNATGMTGTLIVNYRGHGGVNFWAGNPLILSTAHASSWANPTRPVTILTGDCLDGYFVLPTAQGLGETFFRLPEAASAAHLSSSGLGLTYEHSVMVES
ncbi:MAG: C25 family cysteine peptidase, partial [Candidatus Promineifilaceae bacterium]